MREWSAYKMSYRDALMLPVRRTNTKLGLPYSSYTSRPSWKQGGKLRGRGGGRAEGEGARAMGGRAKGKGRGKS